MSIPVENRLLRKALDGDLPKLFQFGFRLDMVPEPYRSAFNILINFHRTHGELPEPSHFQDLLNPLGIRLPHADDCRASATVYFEQLIESYLGQEIFNALEEISLRHNSDKGSAAEFLQYCLSRLRALQQLYDYRGRASKPQDLALDLWNDYCQTESGNFPGIPIEPNFLSLIEALMKWRPTNITTVVSRSGVGKTWFCLIQSLYAMLNGFRVFFASAEMGDAEINQRMAALAAMVNYDRVLKGKLLPDQRQRFQQACTDQHNNVGFWQNVEYLNPDTDMGVDAAEAQADAFGAHLVVADAFYDFPETSSQKDYERINENLKKVRSYSLKKGRHWFLTAQLNKSGKGYWGADEFAMGGSDKFNHISNNVVYLVQDLHMKRNRQVVVKIGKSRSSGEQRPWTHHWSFYDMKWAPISVYVEPKIRDSKKGGPQAGSL